MTASDPFILDAAHGGPAGTVAMAEACLLCSCVLAHSDWGCQPGQPGLLRAFWSACGLRCGDGSIVVVVTQWRAASVISNGLRRYRLVERPLRWGTTTQRRRLREPSTGRPSTRRASRPKPISMPATTPTKWRTCRVSPRPPGLHHLSMSRGLGYYKPVLAAPTCPILACISIRGCQRNPGISIGALRPRTGGSGRVVWLL